MEITTGVHLLQMPVESTFPMAGAWSSRWGNGAVDASMAHWRTRGESHSSYAIWEKASLPAIMPSCLFLDAQHTLWSNTLSRVVCSFLERNDLQWSLVFFSTFLHPFSASVSFAPPISGC
jgi:hypothetical protein